jgi:hypothetical protein
MLLVVKDAKHKPGADFFVEICRLAMKQDDFLCWQFQSLSGSTRRQRLHGWRLWFLFYYENGITPERMRSDDTPAMTVCYFVKHLSQLDTPAYLIRESLAAARRLFEVAQPQSVQIPKDSGFLKDTIRSALKEVVHRSKYREIWKLEILLEFICRGPPSESSARMELMERAAAVSMIFIPCRCE